MSDFAPLFEAHGMEVRGKPFRLNFREFHRIEFSGRLVWVVARVKVAAHDYDPVGYSCSWWYQDMHFDERCATDDLWYVSPEYRGRGIGRRLKEMGHEILEKAGVSRIGDNIRDGGVTADQMAELGFEPWGTRWIRIIPGLSGN